MTYTPGDPASPLQDGEVFEQMKKLSGDPEPDEVPYSFKVSLTAHWQKHFNRNKEV